MPSPGLYWSEETHEGAYIEVRELFPFTYYRSAVCTFPSHGAPSCCSVQRIELSCQNSKQADLNTFARAQKVVQPLHSSSQPEPIVVNTIMEAERGIG